MARGPRITIACDCGEEHKVAYGDEVACSCGRRYRTQSIPAADYEALRALDRRFRTIGYVGGAVLALGVLAVLLTRPFATVVILPSLLLAWFVYGRPLLRRSYRRRVAGLTRSWKIRPEPGTGPRT